MPPKKGTGKGKGKSASKSKSPASATSSSSKKGTKRTRRRKDANFETSVRKLVKMHAKESRISKDAVVAISSMLLGKLDAITNEAMQLNGAKSRDGKGAKHTVDARAVYHAAKVVMGKDHAAKLKSAGQKAGVVAEDL